MYLDASTPYSCNAAERSSIVRTVFVRSYMEQIHVIGLIMQVSAHLMRCNDGSIEAYLILSRSTALRVACSRIPARACSRTRSGEGIRIFCDIADEFLGRETEHACTGREDRSSVGPTAP